MLQKVSFTIYWTFQPKSDFFSIISKSKKFQYIFKSSDIKMKLSRTLFPFVIRSRKLNLKVQVEILFYSESLALYSSFPHLSVEGQAYSLVFFTFSVESTSIIFQIVDLMLTDFHCQHFVWYIGWNKICEMLYAILSKSIVTLEWCFNPFNLDI